MAAGRGGADAIEEGVAEDENATSSLGDDIVYLCDYLALVEFRPRNAAEVISVVTRQLCFSVLLYISQCW